MHLVVRSKHDRLLAGRSSKLYKRVSEQPLAGQYEASVMHPMTQKERVATLELRFCCVELTQHGRVNKKPDRSVVQFFAVQAREIASPADITKPIEWVLLTTLPVESFEEALQIIRYYLLRWVIERFHYLQKNTHSQVSKS